MFGNMSMEPEQQKKFERMMETRSWKILVPAGIVIMIFQIYNIFYALYYTEFRLDTEASRVYMGLYLFLLFFSAVMFLLRFSAGRKTERNDRLFLRMYQWYGIVLVMWAACISAYDQRVSDNLNVYGVAAIGVAALVYMRPAAAVISYFLSGMVLFCAMPAFQPGGMSEHYGSYVNSVVLVITAVFISIYRYETVRDDFRKQELIACQTREIMQKSEALDYIANHDALTGLWNRRFLEICLEEWISRKNSENYGVLMIDVDYFKQYNDTYGHQQGDECLRRISGAVHLVTGRGNLFRYGGEEFLCILPDAEKGETQKLGQEICQSVERLSIKASGQNRVVTVSVGWSAGKMEQKEQFGRLLEEADKALYRAKTEGRNRVEGREV